MAPSQPPAARTLRGGGGLRTRFAAVPVPVSAALDMQCANVTIASAHVLRCVAPLFAFHQRLFVL